MSAKLKPLAKDEELSAIPVEEPVLVELEPTPTSALEDDEQVDQPEKKTRTPAEQDGPAKVLQAQMDDMRKANERLARERDEARRQAQEASTRASDTEADLISNGLQAAQRDATAAKLAIKTAFENSDAEGLADAQERIARASADIREFERAAAVQATEKERPQPQPTQRPSDINEIVDRMQLMPAERDWLKAHPDSLMDPARNKELDVAYIRATREGLIRGTPDYFAFMEKEMGYSKETRRNNEDADERNPMPAAPVSRDSRSAATGKVTANQVYLSPVEREMARNMGVSDKQYALGKQQLDAAKRADPEKYGLRG